MARSKIAITECFGNESPIATEYRRLFQNLRQTENQAELKSILITSAVTGEGKSTVSSLLSITAARKGHRTLLIDCDIRRPSIHALFQLNRRDGLAEIILDGASSKNAIKKTSLSELDVITAGKATPHPSELFDTQAIGDLIGELKFYYDYLILDTPPVIPVSDPMLLAQLVDGVLLVVKAGSTARQVASRAVSIMTTNRAKVLGVVLNNASNSLPYYYDHTHYNYDYSPVGDKADRGSQGERDSKSSHDGKQITP